MKKPRRSKKLLVSTEKVRELQPKQLENASGAGKSCGDSIVDGCIHTLVGGCGYSGGY